MASVDESTVRKLMADIGGEPDVIRELMQTFLEEAPRIVKAMRASLAPMDRRELNRLSHSLKSTSATFGAGALSRLCRDLEQVSERAWPADAASRVTAVEEEWARVRAELIAWKP